MIRMTWQIENINKEVEIKKKQIEILDLKNTITEIKILLDGMNQQQI